MKIRTRRLLNCLLYATRTRTVEIGVYLLLIALSLLLGFDNWRTGMGWASDGPQAGYFPFYLCVILAAASIFGLVTIFIRQNEKTPTVLSRATSFAA